MQYLHPQGQVERRPQFQWNEKALLNKVHKLIYIERERERGTERENQDELERVHLFLPSK